VKNESPDIIIEALSAENAGLREQLRQAENELAEKHEALMQKLHELAELKRLLFGAKSERFVTSDQDSGQLTLFDGQSSVKEVAGQIVATPMVKAHQRRVKAKPKREALPAHLPREVIVLEPEQDTTGLKKIGEEVTETLDYQPAKLRVIRRVRPKYVDPVNEDNGVLIAPLPARPIDKCLAEPSLLAQVVIDKYMDHLPLHRQIQRFSREGITIPSSTLGDWVSGVARLLTPLAKALLVQILQSTYVQVDESTIQVQDGRKKGKTHRGYMWYYHSPEKRLLYLDYRPTRSREGPSLILQNYKGALQSDAYTVYEDYIDLLPDISTYRCMAHARRKFERALQSDPVAAAHAMGLFQQLYAIEREARLMEAGPTKRQELRQQKARPVLDELKTWMDDQVVLPKSPLGQALHYSLVRWDKLSAYTQDGRIEIDNNLIENAIRPLALGRKNYLFAGSHDAAQRSAVLYSLLGTCKLHGVNPYDWLVDVLERVATHPINRVNELLPQHWSLMEKG
jgi:transposase